VLNLLPRRQLAYALAIAFALLVVLPISLFYGLDFRMQTYGDTTCRYLLSDNRGASDLWPPLAWLVAPLAGGLIACITVVSFLPGRLAVSRWRFAVGLVTGVIVVIAVWLAAFSGLLIYDSCPD
jgi:hypothetical protein